MTGVMKDRGSHVIPLAGIAGEFLNAGEDLGEEIEGSRCRVKAANAPQSFNAKFFIMQITRFGHAICTEQE